MNGFVGDTVHIICSIESITTNKRDKEIKLKEITASICALLNCNGGCVVLDINSQGSSKGRLSSSQVSTVIQILEQTMISIIGIQQTISNIHFNEDKESIIVLVQKADSLTTTNYNLYLPSQTMVLLVAATEPPEKIHNVIKRKVIPRAIALGSHLKIFIESKPCGFQESKMVQFKCLKSDSSKRTTLGDRITGKGNKFSCYVSAFSNSNGGHIYYGIANDGVVQGQFIPSEDEKRDVTKKVEKAINKMIWPKQINQPKQGKHWEIFFQPIVDHNSKPIPSTFVIVIYIAPCLGGVFTEEPECYKMEEGKVKKMSFATWKKRILQPVWLWSKEEIPHSVGRIKWSSDRNRTAFIFADRELMQLINNGSWDDISKQGEYLLNKHAQSPHMKLSVLSKRITACYRGGHFNEAQALLQEYTDILPQTQDQPIFEVLLLYLNTALKRASGDFVGLREFLFATLSKAEFIEPGLVTGIVYIFAATVADLVNSEVPTQKMSPQHLSIKALEHWQRVTCSAMNVLPDMTHKIYLTLATFYLGGSINGQRAIGNEEVRLNEAKDCIMAVHKSTCEGNPLSRYSEVQLNLVQSIYYCRYSQDCPNQRARYLGDAFNYAKKAESLAKEYQFAELVEWSKTHKALCTE